MAKIKYDGVLEAAHFKPDGQLDWVRVYIRRGAIFTDRIMLSRQELADQLKEGKRYMLGERIINMGGKFNVSQPVRLVKLEGKEVLVVGEKGQAKGELVGVPVL